jgi:hypothetical protein
MVQFGVLQQQDRLAVHDLARIDHAQGIIQRQLQ